MKLSTGDNEIEVNRAVIKIMREKLALGLKVRVHVSGRSMGFSIPQDSTVMVGKVNSDELRIGDILVIAEKSRLLVHRLKRFEKIQDQRMLITQGDATGFEDFPISEHELLGKVEQIHLHRRKFDLRRASGRVFDCLTESLTNTRRILFRFRKTVRLKIILHQKNEHAHALSKWCYSVSIRVLRFLLRKNPNIQDVILYRSLAHDDWVPGLSDIDLWVTVQTEGKSYSQQAETISQVTETLRRMRFLVPVLGEVMVTPISFLDDWKKYGGVRALEVDRWKTLVGENVHKNSYVFDSERFAWHCFYELERILHWIFFQVKSKVIAHENDLLFHTHLKKQAIDFYRLKHLYESCGRTFLNRREYLAENPSHAVIGAFDSLFKPHSNRFKTYQFIYEQFCADVENFYRSLGKVISIEQQTRSCEFRAYLKKILLNSDSHKKWRFFDLNEKIQNSSPNRETRWSMAVLWSAHAFAIPHQRHLVYALGALHEVNGEEWGGLAKMEQFLESVERVRRLTIFPLSGNFYMLHSMDRNEHEKEDREVENTLN